MNFSSVASDKPSIFNASRLTSEGEALDLLRLAVGLVQYKGFHIVHLADLGVAAADRTDLRDYDVSASC